MRFPWLQVDSDFIAAHAGDLGAHLGISRREAIGLAVDLWTWALARAPDDAPPDGVVTGTGAVPDRLLSGSVGWTGPESVLTEALLACGLAVRIDDGYRLTGFSRYRSTWEKNRRRAGGKPDRNRTGTGDVPTRKTQTQTHIEAVKDPPAGAAAPSQAGLFGPPPPVPAEAPRKPKAKREPAGDPRHRPLTEALVAADVELRGAPYGHRGGRDAKAVTECLSLADQSPETAGEKAPEEVLRRWRVARRWQGYPACGSLSDLATHWNTYVREQEAPGVRPVNVRRGSVGAENFDHSHVGPVENF